MENIALEIFSCPEFTTPCIVPVHWSDAASWSDASTFAETQTVQGIFHTAYLGLDLGRSGQDTAQNTLRIPTASCPGAKEGDPVIINAVTYTIGTPRPDSKGVTTMDLLK